MIIALAFSFLFSISSKYGVNALVSADSIMEPYLRYLYTYLSVSGPHLGYLYSSNSLFNSGMWVLKKLKNTQCIHQLTFTDDPDLQNTFLFKLCKVLRCFQAQTYKHIDPVYGIALLTIDLLFILSKRMGNISCLSMHFLSFAKSLKRFYLIFQQKTLENFKHIILLSSPQVSAFFYALLAKMLTFLTFFFFFFPHYNHSWNLLITPLRMVTFHITLPELNCARQLHGIVQRRANYSWRC